MIDSIKAFEEEGHIPGAPSEIYHGRDGVFVHAFSVADTAKVELDVAFIFKVDDRLGKNTRIKTAVKRSKGKLTPIGI